jgi:hypothetical protein
MKCVYCPNDASKSKKAYHIAPYAAGNRTEYLHPLEELILPQGLACDACNEYFGSKLEQGLANHPCVQQHRAAYGIRGRKGQPSYADDAVTINTTGSGILVLSGEDVSLGQGGFQVPQPSVAGVNHLQVSRAVHKIAFEHALLEIAQAESVEAARIAAQQEPLSDISRYIRRGHSSSYRPYGFEPQGANRVSIVPCRFESDPSGAVISPRTFTGYIVGLPGARFSCTLASDSSLLRYMLQRIESMDAKSFLTTRHVYWTL